MTWLIPIALILGALISLFVVGLAEAATEAPTRPDPIAELKARYGAAIKRGDTRGQSYAYEPLKAARTAQLRREMGR